MQKVQYALDTNYQVSYRRAKLLVVSSGGVGQTSTIRSLLGQDFLSEYNSTEVADANVQVSLLSAVHWRQQNNHTEAHLMDNDFKQVVAQIEEDKAVETYAPVSLTDVPALNYKVVEAISVSSAQEKLQPRKSTACERPSRSEMESSVAHLTKEPTPPALLSSGQQPISFTIWDFGGQSVFYYLHQMFLTKNGVYLAVFNLKLVLNNTAAELQKLSFWFDALTIHASDAPVALVGTHAGELDPKEIRIVDETLTDFCKDKELNFIFNEKEDMMFFPVENSLGKNNEKYLAPLKEEIH